MPNDILLGAGMTALAIYLLVVLPRLHNRKAKQARMAEIQKLLTQEQEWKKSER